MGLRNRKKRTAAAFELVDMGGVQPLEGPTG